MSNKLSFNIENELKWSSLEGEYGPLQILKKMQARRMTSLSKKVVDMALRCVGDVKVDYIVYSSRHGEVNLSLNLITSILNEELPSPMNFSQSTHNAPLGLFSIYGKNQAPGTAISAGKDSFKMGLVSALGFLNCNPDKKVLCIYAEPKIDQLYCSKVSDAIDEKIWCGILSNGTKSNINNFRVEFG